LGQIIFIFVSCSTEFHRRLRPPMSSWF